MVDIYRDKIGFGETLRMIGVMAIKWEPLLIGIEAVAYQQAVPDELIRTTKLPIKGIKSPPNKVVRARALSVYFEQGRVYFKDSLVVAQDEFLEFPAGEHDDIVDAVGYGVRTAQLVRPRGKPKVRNIKFKKLNMRDLGGLKL